MKVDLTDYSRAPPWHKFVPLDLNEASSGTSQDAGACACNSNSELGIILTRKGESIKCSRADLDWLSQHTWHLANGYATTGISGQSSSISMHRMIMSPPNGFEVDHINRDRTDNRRCNLRICTRSQNATNKQSKPSKTGFRGVDKKWIRYVTPRYVATIWVSRKVFRGQPRLSAVEAAHDYDRMAIDHYGEFAVLNFPESRKS